MTILEALQPYIIETVAVIGGAVAVWIGRMVQQKIGIDLKLDQQKIEMNLAAILHTAMETGASSAAMKGLTGEAAVKAVIDHVAASIPNTLSKLAPAPDVLANLARAKLQQLL